MLKDLTVYLEDRPGTIADLGEALGDAGINIEGSCGQACEGRGVIHVLVQDASAASSLLASKGFEVGETREVLVIDAQDRPGFMGLVARKIASAGVNVDLMYFGTNNRLVLGADDLDQARAAL